MHNPLIVVFNYTIKINKVKYISSRLADVKQPETSVGYKPTNGLLSGFRNLIISQKNHIILDFLNDHTISQGYYI